MPCIYLSHRPSTSSPLLTLSPSISLLNDDDDHSLPLSPPVITIAVFFLSRARSYAHSLSLSHQPIYGGRSSRCRCSCPPHLSYTYVASQSHPIPSLTATRSLQRRVEEEGGRSDNSAVRAHHGAMQRYTTGFIRFVWDS